ncbi:cupin domain-containing protein [candidate division WOR-3 bacterium]|uniref:Cupin domain-containing protein n=1 Tax=candidate division WOR-3 bacterium TaxID=2052148 RepID=A0A9D5KA66_UNCW3|nr:cupin domain-containing protein [candidate division WOR-3 bacterium]MBD3365168.1 cupin domain-containing protein [candidate division WOR-3 bacterium]
MLVRSVDQISQDNVEQEGAEGVKIRWLISKYAGAPNFAMREFEIEPEGHTPYHSHDWEHEVFVLSGEGVVVSEGEQISISRDTVVFVPGGQMHNFRNTGSGVLRFLCLVPHKKD